MSATPIAAEAGAGRLDLRRVTTVVLFGLLPAALPVSLVVYLVRHGSYSHGDFYDLHTMWEAGRHVAHGESPYPFVYPAPAAVLMAPIGALPWRAAVAVFFVLLIASVCATLRLLGVRDWRCYGACLVSMPTVSAIGIGTLSPLLGLATACAWRWRDRRAVVVLAVAFVVVTKLFLWPLLIWLLATKRFRSALFGAGASVAVTASAWALIGFAGLSSYGSRLGDLASLEQYKSYSTRAFVHAAGIAGNAESLAMLVIALLALGAVVVLGRRPEGDFASFVAAIGAALLISPIVWIHYLVLLFIPIALARPRLSGLWLVPMLFWAVSGQESYGSIPRLIWAFAIVLFVLWWSTRLQSRRRAAPEARSPSYGWATAGT